MDEVRTDAEPARDHGSRAALLPGQAVRAGLTGHCPNCGQGQLFAGFLRVTPNCAACSYDLARIDTGDGAATFIMQIAGFVVGFSALVVEMRYHPPMALHLAIWPVLVVMLALALMRPGKGLMTALQMLRSRDD